jgi:hypothetical protein
MLPRDDAPRLRLRVEELVVRVRGPLDADRRALPADVRVVEDARELRLFAPERALEVLVRRLRDCAPARVDAERRVALPRELLPAVLRPDRLRAVVPRDEVLRDAVLRPADLLDGDLRAVVREEPAREADFLAPRNAVLRPVRLLRVEEAVARERVPVLREPLVFRAPRLLLFAALREPLVLRAPRPLLLEALRAREVPEVPALRLARLLPRARALAVSRPTSLLKLLCPPRANWSCTSRARLFSSKALNQSSQPMCSSESAPLKPGKSRRIMPVSEALPVPRTHAGLAPRSSAHWRMSS